MLPKTLTLALFAGSAAAVAAAAPENLDLSPAKIITPSKPVPLIKRQSDGQCGFLEEECGVGCLPSSWTCCPSGAGGCPILQNCQLGSNGEYGCCPIGKTCIGAGGVTTGDFGSSPDPTGNSGSGGGSSPDATTTDDLGLPTVTPTGGLSFPGGSDDSDDDSSLTTSTSDPAATTTARGFGGGNPGGAGDTTNSDEGSSAARNGVAFAGALAALLAL